MNLPNAVARQPLESPTIRSQTIVACASDAARRIDAFAASLYIVCDSRPPMFSDLSAQYLTHCFRKDPPAALTKSGLSCLLMTLHTTEATPAAVLKAIRDGRARDWDDLNRLFLDDACSRHTLRRTMGELGVAGLITRSGVTYSVTEAWMKIQGVLGVSLTSLDEVSQPGVISVKPIFGLPDSGRVVPDVFVLMPFAEDLLPVYVDHISHAVRNLGLSVGRADDFFTVHEVIRDVWIAISRARVVIADCTGRNPNVFYEIGMAHTVGKAVVLIAQNEEDIPFDLRHLRFITYA